MLDHHIKKLKKKLFKKKDGGYEVSVLELQKLQPAKTYLYELFKEFSFTEWNDVNDLLTATSGKQILSKTHRLLKDRNHLYLKPITEKSEEVFYISESENQITAPINLKITTVDAISTKNSHTIYIDKETLKFPLLLRKWKKGDYFYPFGMGGKKKISKYFKDEKYSVFDKENQWLLCSKDDIVWIIGKRLDNRFKITPNTREILKIEILL